MKCTNCGAEFASDQLRYPYCGTVNEAALKLAKELQTYDAAYEKKRDELLETGTNQVLSYAYLAYTKGKISEDKAPYIEELKEYLDTEPEGQWEKTARQYLEELEGE